MTGVTAGGTFGKGNVVNRCVGFFLVLMLRFQQRLIFVF